MNRIGIGIVMFIIAGIICGCEIITVSNSYRNFSNELENISRLMSEENFERAGKLSYEVFENWKKTAKHLDKYLYHDYIDNISADMATLPVYADNKDKIAVTAQIEDIKIQLTSLKESELPYLHNIL
ncbi:MAG: DUF4363 family protein [Clostridia bacterium]|nr:DUF4363 family protein [Clostridia bacterium]